MKWKWLIIGMLFFAIACGNELDESSGEPTATDPIMIENENSADANQASGKEDTSEPAEEGKMEDAPSSSADDAEVQTAEKLYRMNDYYLIVPKEEDIDKKVVLLTFDDGPKEEEMVAKMMKILDKHQAKAIFFVNGYRVEQNPELLKMMYDHGHAIGNHSWDHINLREASQEKIDQQVEDVQMKVEELIGTAPQFFRPPHGAGNDYLRQKVKEEGMLYMTWSTSPEDWLQQNQTADKIIENTLDRVHPGANLLMHELPWTVEALDTLLAKLKEEGYSFVDPHTIEINLN